MLHVAIVPSRHPAARIVSIDAAAALAIPGVHHVLTGAELAAPSTRCSTGSIRRACAAIRSRSDRRAMRANGSRRWSRTRARSPRMPPSWSRSHTSRCRFVIDVEQALDPASPQVHPEHGSNVLLDKTFVWGEVEQHFAESAAPALVPRHLGTQLHGSDRDVRRAGVVGPLARDARRVGLDPDAEICRADRPRAAAARQRGARALRCRCRRQLRRQARHQAHRAGGASRAQARPAGAADRGPARQHALGRPARPGPHLRRVGRLRRCRHRQVDEDARARQCRRLCGTRAVPARQADRRHRRSVQHRERAVPGDRR